LVNGYKAKLRNRNIGGKLNNFSGQEKYCNRIVETGKGVFVDTNGIKNAAL
jgi:hypothetical protein